MLGGKIIVSQDYEFQVYDDSLLPKIFAIAESIREEMHTALLDEIDAEDWTEEAYEDASMSLDALYFKLLLEMKLSQECIRLGMSLADIVNSQLRDIVLRTNIFGPDALRQDIPIPKKWPMSLQKKYHSSVTGDAVHFGIGYFATRGIPISEKHLTLSINALIELAKALALLEDMTRFGLQTDKKVVDLEDTDISDTADLTRIE